MKKLGFIGMGNMAKALAAGFIGKKAIEAQNVFAYAPNQEKLKKNAEEIGFTPVAGLTELVNAVDTIIMACKPYQIESVLSDIKNAADCEGLTGKNLISVAAGWDFDKYSQYIGKETGFQFVMPNTPAMVGEGVLLFEEKNSLPEEERDAVKALFASVGIVEELPSNLMGIGGAVAGCGPAFVDLLIEAYADAGVKYGLQRATAYRFVEQMILGSAKLALETGKHPGILKDEVCSPGGTTIRGVAALESEGFRAACEASIDAIMDFKKS